MPADRQRGEKPLMCSEEELEGTARVFKRTMIAERAEVNTVCLRQKWYVDNWVRGDFLLRM